jgi:hypothetical protein
MYGNYNHQAYIRKHKQVNKESIFKVGDWVVHKHSTTPVLVKEVYLGNGKYPQQFNSMQYSSNYTLWQPQPGEWVWVWGIYNPHPVLRKLLSVCQETEFEVEPILGFSQTQNYSHAQPFIGTLPEQLKDN